MTIAAFFGMSLSNSIEILFFIFGRFKRRKGLYFWSMLVACIGIPVHAIAVLVRMFGLVSNVAMSLAVVLGWWAMVTGQAIVLYSRLHLVSDRKKTRCVLIMIGTNFIVLHLPVSALYLAINVRSSNSLTNVFKIYEKTQLVGFSIQECIIAGIYIWEASRILNHVLESRGPQGKKMIRHLILVNVLVVALDASLVVTEFTGNFDIQTTYKTVVYSIKLKLEFYVLNQLLLFLQHPTCTCSNSTSLLGQHIETPNFGLLSLTSTPTLQRRQRNDATASSQFRLERIYSAGGSDDCESLHFHRGWPRPAPILPDLKHDS